MIGNYKLHLRYLTPLVLVSKDQYEVLFREVSDTIALVTIFVNTYVCKSQATKNFETCLCFNYLVLHRLRKILIELVSYCRTCGPIEMERRYHGKNS